MSWGAVEDALTTAAGVSFDGCHKIYVLMDEAQVEQSRKWGYGGDDSSLLTRAEFATEHDMFEQVHAWFEDSCALRFVQGVSTVDGDPNEGYVNLIAQFEFEEDDE